jgi:hypothetical protein
MAMRAFCGTDNEIPSKISNAPKDLARFVALINDIAKKSHSFEQLIYLIDYPTT